MSQEHDEHCDHDQGHDHGDHGHGDHDHGPEGTGFLELELSRMLAGKASEMVRDAFGDLLREALREALHARLGDRIAALADVVAEDFAADVEANLAIEQTIDQRRSLKAEVGERARKAFLGAPPAPAATPKKAR